MKVPRLRTPASGTAWLLAFAVLIAGYAVIDTHYERAIARADASSAQYARRANAYEGILVRARALNDVSRRAEAELSRSGNNLSGPDRLSWLLGMLDALSRRCEVRLDAVTPGEEAATATDDGLVAAPLHLRLSGRFSSVVRFIDLLPRTGEPIGIAEVRLSANSQDSGHTTIEADLTAQLYRLSDREV